LITISASLDQFSKLFHCRIPKETLRTFVIKLPHHMCC